MKKEEYYTLNFALCKAIARAKDASFEVKRKVFKNVKLKDKAFSEAGFTVDSDGNISMASPKISFHDFILGEWKIVE